MDHKGHLGCCTLELVHAEPVFFFGYPIRKNAAASSVGSRLQHLNHNGFNNRIITMGSHFLFKLSPILNATKPQLAIFFNYCVDES